MVRVVQLLALLTVISNVSSQDACTSQGAFRLLDALDTDTTSVGYGRLEFCWKFERDGESVTEWGTLCTENTEAGVMAELACKELGYDTGVVCGVDVECNYGAGASGTVSLLFADTDYGCYNSIEECLYIQAGYDVFHEYFTENAQCNVNTAVGIQCTGPQRICPAPSNIGCRANIPTAPLWQPTPDTIFACDYDCSTAVCPGNTDATCCSDGCTCSTHFRDANGNPAKCFEGAVSLPFVLTEHCAKQPQELQAMFTFTLQAAGFFSSSTTVSVSHYNECPTDSVDRTGEALLGFLDRAQARALHFAVESNVNVFVEAGITFGAPTLTLEPLQCDGMKTWAADTDSCVCPRGYAERSPGGSCEENHYIATCDDTIHSLPNNSEHIEYTVICAEYCNNNVPLCPLYGEEVRICAAAKAAGVPDVTAFTLLTDTSQTMPEECGGNADGSEVGTFAILYQEHMCTQSEANEFAICLSPYGECSTDTYSCAQQVADSCLNLYQTCFAELLVDGQHGLVALCLFFEQHIQLGNLTDGFPRAFRFCAERDARWTPGSIRSTMVEHPQLAIFRMETGIGGYWGGMCTYGYTGGDQREVITAGYMEQRASSVCLLAGYSATEVCSDCHSLPSNRLQPVWESDGPADLFSGCSQQFFVVCTEPLPPCDSPGEDGTRNADGTCHCSPAFNREDGACVFHCPALREEASMDMCVCVAGYARDQNGDCISTQLQLSDVLALNWWGNADGVSITFEVETTNLDGWVAIGFNYGTRCESDCMDGVDAIMMRKNGDNCEISDRKVVQNWSPPHEDETQDVRNCDLASDGTTNRYTFERDITTLDTDFDVDFRSNPVWLFWSFNPDSNDFTLGHIPSNRGQWRPTEDFSGFENFSGLPDCSVMQGVPDGHKGCMCEAGYVEEDGNCVKECTNELRAEQYCSCIADATEGCVDQLELAAMPSSSEQVECSGEMCSCWTEIMQCWEASDCYTANGCIDVEQDTDTTDLSCRYHAHCVECHDGEVPNGDGGCTCVEPYVRNESTGECACTSGAIDTNGECACPAFTRNANHCTHCVPLAQEGQGCEPSIPPCFVPYCDEGLVCHHPEPDPFMPMVGGGGNCVVPRDCGDSAETFQVADNGGCVCIEGYGRKDNDEGNPCIEHECEDNEQCGSGEYCRCGFCVAYASEGEECMHSSECRGNVVDCGEGLLCGVDFSFGKAIVLAPPPGTSGLCTKMRACDDEMPCDSGQWCNMDCGTCENYRDILETCSMGPDGPCDYRHCDPRLSCTEVLPFFGKTQPQGLPVDGVCMENCGDASLTHQEVDIATGTCNCVDGYTTKPHVIGCVEIECTDTAECDDNQVCNCNLCIDKARYGQKCNPGDLSGCGEIECVEGTVCVDPTTFGSAPPHTPPPPDTDGRCTRVVQCETDEHCLGRGWCNVACQNTCQPYVTRLGLCHAQTDAVCDVLVCGEGLTCEPTFLAPSKLHVTGESNQVIGTCVANCPPHSRFVAGECTCSRGYHMDNEQCVVDVVEEWWEALVPIPDLGQVLPSLPTPVFTGHNTSKHATQQGLVKLFAFRFTWQTSCKDAHDVCLRAGPSTEPYVPITGCNFKILEPGYSYVHELPVDGVTVSSTCAGKLVQLIVRPTGVTILVDGNSHDSVNMMPRTPCTSLTVEEGCTSCALLVEPVFESSSDTKAIFRHGKCECTALHPSDGAAGCQVESLQDCESIPGCATISTVTTYNVYPLIDAEARIYLGVYYGTASNFGVAGPLVDIPIRYPFGPSGYVADHSIWCPQEGRMDTDTNCLTLDIYTPSKDPPPEGFPVMVLVQGDGLRGGTADVDGSAVAADQDSILVAVNYRLGWLGFADFGDSNFAVSDIVEAIKFIHAEIDKFGGNPSQILVVGHGMGANLVSACLTNVELGGMISAAVLMSAPHTGDSVWPFGDSKVLKLQEESQAMLLECSDENPTVVLECLQTVDITPILNRPAPPMYFTGGVAAGTSFTTNVQSGTLHEIPIVIGNVINDGIGVVADAIGDMQNVLDGKDISDRDLNNIIHIIGEKLTNSGGFTRQREQEIKTFYYEKYEGATNIELAAMIATDVLFGCPNTKVANVIANYRQENQISAEVYQYIFAPELNPDIPDALRHLAPGSSSDLGTLFAPHEAAVIVQNADFVSAQLRCYFESLARTSSLAGGASLSEYCTAVFEAQADQWPPHDMIKRLGVADEAWDAAHSDEICELWNSWECGRNEVPDAAGTCICAEPAERNNYDVCHIECPEPNQVEEDGECIPSCISPSEWNPSTESCECVDGYRTIQPFGPPGMCPTCALIAHEGEPCGGLTPCGDAPSCEDGLTCHVEPEWTDDGFPIMFGGAVGVCMKPEDIVEIECVMDVECPTDSFCICGQCTLKSGLDGLCTSLEVKTCDRKLCADDLVCADLLELDAEDVKKAIEKLHNEAKAKWKAQGSVPDLIPPPVTLQRGLVLPPPGQNGVCLPLPEAIYLCTHDSHCEEGEFCRCSQCLPLAKDLEGCNQGLLDECSKILCEPHLTCKTPEDQSGFTLVLRGKQGVQAIPPLPTDDGICVYSPLPTMMGQEQCEYVEEQPVDIAVIDCGPGFILEVMHAQSGPNPDSCSPAGWNFIDCSSDPLPLLQDRCIGKSKCEILWNDLPLGDCNTDTGRVLVASYACQELPSYCTSALDCGDEPNFQTHFECCDHKCIPVLLEGEACSIPDIDDDDNCQSHHCAFGYQCMDDVCTQVEVCTGDHETQEGTQCVCEEGYAYSDGICTTLPTIDDCEENEQLNEHISNVNPDICVCKEDFTRDINGDCVSDSVGGGTCDSSKHLVPDGNDGCECEDGYTMDTNGDCIEDSVSTCDSSKHLVPDGSDGCECEDGYTMDTNGGCIEEEEQCDANSVLKCSRFVAEKLGCLSTTYQPCAGCPDKKAYDCSNVKRKLLVASGCR